MLLLHVFFEEIYSKERLNGQTAMHDSKSIVHSYTEFLGAMF